MKAAAALVVLAAVMMAGGAAQPAGKGHDPVGTIAGPFGETTLGSTITFQTTTDNLKGNQYPLVDLECFQDGSIVFAQLDYPDANFLLGGGSSYWLEHGGDATCIAYLDAYSKQFAPIVLNQTAEFEATG